jgi:D-alanine-D-alanine ligase
VTKPSPYVRRGPKRRVLLLCHEELVPPDSIQGLSDEEIKDFRTEFDVLSTLRDLGHEAEALGLDEDIDAIRRACLEYRPDLCFNLVVEFHGAANYDQHVVSHLELLRQDYTGCNPLGLTLARDKALSKKILTWEGLPVPHFGVFPKGRRTKRPPGLELPLFVKSVNEEASLGISRKSIVRTDAALQERVAYVHETVGTDAIAEEYIEGREFYVGVLGNTRLETFPVWELHIPNLPEGAPRIATRRMKWDLAYQKKMGVRNRRADLDARTEAEMAAVAKKVYRALRLSGYARLDVRMRPDGRFYVLEANPNPDLTFGEDFAETAEAAGICYEELIDRLLKLGVDYRAEWKERG